MPTLAKNFVSNLTEATKIASVISERETKTLEHVRDDVLRACIFGYLLNSSIREGEKIKSFDPSIWIEKLSSDDQIAIATVIKKYFAADKLDTEAIWGEHQKAVQQLTQIANESDVKLRGINEFWEEEINLVQIDLVLNALKIARLDVGKTLSNIKNSEPFEEFSALGESVCSPN